MGTDSSKEPAGWKDEEPQHPQRFEKAYWIGRFPITVAQYQAFVDATAHTVDRKALEGLPSAPVVLVSWHDAQAYCGWLQQCFERLAPDRISASGEDVQGRFWSAVASGVVKVGLPSEPEWERAARGPESRVYPWVGACSPLLANYDDTRIDGPSVVGCFPAGVSADGCHDMAGNVWEWTRSLWGTDYAKVEKRYRYPYDAGNSEKLDADDDVLRVLRGGGFRNTSNNLRCAVRNRNNPNNRNTESGFRVVWSTLSDSGMA